MSTLGEGEQEGRESAYCCKLEYNERYAMQYGQYRPEPGFEKSDIDMCSHELRPVPKGTRCRVLLGSGAQASQSCYFIKAAHTFIDEDSSKDVRKMSPQGFFIDGARDAQGNELSAEDVVAFMKKQREKGNLPRGLWVNLRKMLLSTEE